MSAFVDVRPPSGMTLAREGQWWKFYNRAMSCYRHVEDYGPSDAMTTANAAVRGLSGLPRAAGDFPDPGDLLSLGLCLEIDTAEPGGAFGVMSWTPSDGVHLWWSSRLKACLVYPKLQLRDARCRIAPTRSEHALVRKWTDGNYGARSVCEARPPTPPIAKCSPAIAVTYRSRKFSPNGTLTTYMHHHDPRVVVYESAGRVPEAIMIRGGRLRLTRLGLDG